MLAFLSTSLFLFPLTLYLLNPSLARGEAKTFEVIWPKLTTNSIVLAVVVALVAAGILAALFRKHSHALGAFSLLLFCLYDVRPFGFEGWRGAAGFFRGAIFLFVLYSFRETWRKIYTNFKTIPQLFELHPSPPKWGWVILSYLIVFSVLTFPTILEFNSHFFSDSWDGYQMLWNFWWFNKAVMSGTNPFFTDYLHTPDGTTLIGASFHPFKSLLAVPFIPVIGIIKSYNLIFVLTFCLAGLFTYFLAFAISGSVLGAWLAGFFYAFCQNRFAHGAGHFHVISNEWVPAFLLAWLYLLKKPRKSTALFASALLFVALMSDYYSFLFCVLAGALIFLIHALWLGSASLFEKKRIEALFCFLAPTLVSSGIFVLFLLATEHRDPWVGNHWAAGNPMDLLSPFIPGGYWRFSFLTSGFWQKLISGVNESSVYVGWSAILLAFASRRLSGALIWFLAAVFFFVLALGPYLNVWGTEIPLGLPYIFAERNLPGFRLSGCPIRMSFVLTLACALLAALGVRELVARKNYLLLSGLILLSFIEYLPKRGPTTKIQIPDYVKYIQRFDDKEAPLLDAVSSFGEQLMYQTVHQRKMAFGYIARIPKSAINLEGQLRELIDEQDFAALCLKHGFRLAALPESTRLRNEVIRRNTVYQGEKVRIVDLKPNGECVLPEETAVASSIIPDSPTNQAENLR